MACRGVVLLSGCYLATAANQAPFVTLEIPPPVSWLAEGDTVQLLATAGDPDGSVAKVEFHVDGLLLGEATAPPFGVRWPDVIAGTHELLAVAVDNALERSTSAVAHVIVEAISGPHNLGWAVPAGTLREWNETAFNWSRYGSPTIFRPGDIARFQGSGPAFIGLNGTPGACVSHGGNGGGRSGLPGRRYPHRLADR